MTTNETIKQQHTPGPWTLGPIEPAEISRGHWITHGSYKGVIGILGGSPSEANAALIAAAPETAAERDRLRQVNEVMLEALQGVIGYLGEGSEHPDPCSTNPTWLSGADVEGPCDCYVGRVVAAIAAAEGK